MTLIARTARMLWFAATYGVCCIAWCPAANAQDVSGMSSPTLMQQMVGTWKVRQRMWPGIDAPPVNLPPAVARRFVPADRFCTPRSSASARNRS